MPEPILLDTADAPMEGREGDSPPSPLGATQSRACEAGGLPSVDEEVRKRSQSVLVVICHRGGEFLLMRRTRPAGFWQSVTGSLWAGETPRHAAARETFEETGLRVGGALIDLHQCVLFPIIRAWRRRYAPNVCFNREYWFALVLESRRLIRLDPREHVEYRWLGTSAALALASSRTNRDAIRTLSGLAP